MRSAVIVLLIAVTSNVGGAIRLIRTTGTPLPGAAQAALVALAEKEHPDAAGMSIETSFLDYIDVAVKQSGAYVYLPAAEVSPGLCRGKMVVYSQDEKSGRWESSEDPKYKAAIPPDFYSYFFTQSRTSKCTTLNGEPVPIYGATTNADLTGILDALKQVPAGKFEGGPILGLFHQKPLTYIVRKPLVVHFEKGDKGWSVSEIEQPPE